MSFSEDELAPPITDVTDYTFVNGDDEPVSFADLSLHFNDEIILDGNRSQERVYLRGKTDEGFRSAFTEVVAWKFNLSCFDKPVISVLPVDGNWIKLCKPIRAFEHIIRTVLITVEFLHIVKWNLKISSKKGLWDCLCRRFSMFDSKPCKEDLIDHVALIQEMVKRDKTLASASKIISTFLKEKSRKIKDSEPSELSFVVHESDNDENEDYVSLGDENEGHISVDDNDDGEADDYVCSICDNGGDLTQCEGKCMRSFHLTKEAGEADCCSSLGFTKEQVEQMKDFAFYCKNCKYSRHQCFSCGQLGSSDESSIGYAKVFRCINGTCGRFYHPNCAAKLLHPNDEVAMKHLCQHISLGGHFTCPAHKCDVCKELELKSDKQLQFAICRRCPRAYHRKCLPGNIAFEADVNEGRTSVQRAWDDMIPNRVLIYCLDHDIDDDLLTPVRNHITFPPDMDSLEGTNYLVEDTSSKAEELEETHIIVSANKREKNTVTLDDDERKRVLSLMKDVAASITLEEIQRKHEGEAPSTNANSSKLSEDNITLGKVEASVEAVRAALEILDKGGCLQDAKAVCGDDDLLRLGKWKETLRADLAPFLYETRYMSSGYYIIEMDKLHEIVNMLHCYIQAGDTVVDLCCGPKDLSSLLKRKLMKEGKPCSFKNFDIAQTCGFSFEKKDWMTVEPHELPDASRMIMTLNPPLGVNVSVVNELINEALVFKPKLLVLMVPHKTQRLDEKESPYDLIWEDDEMLAEKSCHHLLGSVDEHDKPMDDWKMEARILHLWSNPDWTQKYKAVAELHGHRGTRKNRIVEENLNHEELKSIGGNSCGPSNDRSEGNPKDSANNKKKVDVDKKAAAKKRPNKRPALNPPLLKLGPSEAHQSKLCMEYPSDGTPKDKKRRKKEVDMEVPAKMPLSKRPALDPSSPGAHSPKHLEKKSTHIPSMETGRKDKGVSEDHVSENLEKQSPVQNSNDSPTYVSKLDCGNKALTEWCMGNLENSTSALPAQLHVDKARSHGSLPVSSHLSRQVSPAPTSTMQKNDSCLNDVNHVPKTTKPVKHVGGSLDFSPSIYSPRPGTEGWLDE